MVVEMRYDDLRDSGVQEGQSTMKPPSCQGAGRIPELLERVMAKIDGCHKRVYVLEERISTVLRPQDDSPSDVFPEVDDLSPVARDLIRCIQGLDALMMRIDMTTDRVEL